MNSEEQIQEKLQDYSEAASTTDINKQSASTKIKAYTWTIEALMYVYACVFIYVLTQSGYKTPAIISFVINLTITITFALFSRHVRGLLISDPPSYQKSKFRLRCVIIWLAVYYALEGLSAVGVYFSAKGKKGALKSAIIIGIVSFPAIVLVFVGICVLKNYMILEAAVINMETPTETREDTIQIHGRGKVPYSSVMPNTSLEESSEGEGKRAGYGKVPEEGLLSGRGDMVGGRDSDGDGALN